MDVFLPPRLCFRNAFHRVACAGGRHLEEDGAHHRDRCRPPPHEQVGERETLFGTARAHKSCVFVSMVLSSLREGGVFALVLGGAPLQLAGMFGNRDIYIYISQGGRRRGVCNALF